MDMGLWEQAGGGPSKHAGRGGVREQLLKRLAVAGLWKGFRTDRVGGHGGMKETLLFRLVV